MTKRHADVLVIGGGLHGCSTALHLAISGARVIVVEKDYIGRHASGVNAGGVRRLGRHPAEIPLSVASMALWHRIAELVDDDCGFQQHGQVKVAESAEELEILRRRVEAVHELGYTHEELVDQSELRALLPAISPHCVGGIVSRDDGAANPYRTTLAFKRKAAEHKVQFDERALVTRVQRQGAIWRAETRHGTAYEARVMVNCAGAWADRIAASIGEPVPLEPLALMLMISNRMQPFLKPVVGATGRVLSFKQFPNGTVLIGGGHQGSLDRETNWTELDFSRLAVSAQTVYDLFPVMRDAQIVRCWAGIEARMPDDIPVIGPSSTSEDAYHAFGFSGHGFQLGPIVGRMLAQLILTGKADLPIAPFSIRRFTSTSAA